MPKNNKKNTLSRQLVILRLLSGHSEPCGQTVKSICGELARQSIPALERSVSRDLDMLCQMGLVRRERAQDRSYRYAARAGWAAGVLSPAEALGWVLAYGALSQIQIMPLLLGEGLAAIKERYENASKATSRRQIGNWGDDFCHYTDISALFAAPKWDAASANRDAVETILNAVRERRELQAVYKSARGGGKTKTHILNPLGVFQKEHVTYLLATERGAQSLEDLRTYNLLRFSSAAYTGEDSVPPKGFLGLKRFLEQGGSLFGDLSACEIELVAEASRNFARYLEEVPFRGMEWLPAKRNGWRRFRVRLKRSWALKSWILSKGAEIRVLRPAAFAREIADAARAVAALYGKPRRG